MDGLAAELTQREFNEWQEYFRDEPFGQRHLDYVIATLTAVVANMMRDPDEPPIPTDQFIPTYGPPKDIANDDPVAADIAYIDSLVATGLVLDRRVH